MKRHNDHSNSFKGKYLMEVGLQFKGLGNHYHKGNKVACRWDGEEEADSSTS